MAENYILLETINLTQTASSVTFNNLPSTGYTDLKIVASYRGSGSNVYEVSNLRFNGLNANLSSKTLEGSGTSADSVSNAQIYFGAGNGATSTANTFCNIEAYIPNYTSGNQKSVTVHSVGENNANLAYTQLTSGLWADVASITSIEIVPANSFLANSTFSLYAIAATGTTPVTAPFARGGNIVFNDGTYWYHEFLSSGTFTPFKELSCTTVVVASGAGGAGDQGGGGGAGGYRSSTLSYSATGYAVVVGAGGAAAAVGNTSSISTLSAGGGEQGAHWSAPAKGDVGTGDNAAFQGGNAANGGGGGGGAGISANGTAAVNGSTAGNGGAGLALLGKNVGGGGGGGVYQSLSGGTASFGGGAGGRNANGTAGTANTGGGGGGGGWDGTVYSGAAGGSGIVMIRYPMV
jgi:hypothetical protein